MKSKRRWKYKGILVVMIIVQLISNDYSVVGKTVLEIGLGDGKTQISKEFVSTGEECVPEAFCVGGNGVIYILDNGSKKIKYYGQSGYIGEIDISFSEYIRDMVCIEGTLYLLDQEARKIYQVEVGTKEKLTICLPSEWETHKVIGISIDIADKNPIVQYGNQVYKVTNDKVERIEEVEVVEGKLLAKDVGYMVIEKYTLLNLPIIAGDLIIEKINLDNEVIAKEKIELAQKYQKTPYKIIECNENSQLYQLILKDDVIIIEEKEWKKISRFKNRTKINSEQKGILEGFETLGRIYAHNDRREAEENAIQMSELEWTYDHDSNKGTGEGIIIPTYLKEEVQQTQGIPYCWGGFNGLSNQNSNSFLIKIRQGALPGNIKCSGQYKEQTAGLDCSGFVSNCAGFSEKLNTYNLAHLTYTYPILQEERKVYDIYVKAGDHVVFFVEELANGIVTMEATISGKEKVKTYFRPYSWLINNGYMLRRFYGW